MEKSLRPKYRSKFALGRPDPEDQVAQLRSTALESDGTEDITSTIDSYTKAIQDSVAEALASNKQMVQDFSDSQALKETKDFKTPKATYQNVGSLLELVDRTEGAGDYNTLFGFAQDKDTPFKGMAVTDKTIDELIEFTDPKGEYGQWVKARNDGVVGTPLGRYQIIGTTLKDVAEDMGLSGDTKFTPEVQDMMFAHLASRRLAKANNDSQILKELRNEWHGFKSVDDDTLLAAAKQFKFSLLPKQRPQGLGAKNS